MKYNIWSEGRAGNKDFGEDLQAELMDEVEADSFEAACDLLFREDTLYEKHDGKLFYFGLQLHDNEFGARQANG